MTTWTPTHRITFTPVNGAPQLTEVMEAEGGLYTRQEWDDSDGPDWSIDEDGSVSFQGQAAPSNGTVRVEKV